MSAPSCPPGRRRGGAAVEFGLVLPVLLVLLLGLMDAGWVFHQHGVLVRAVRQGCRAGAVIGADSDPAATASAAISAALVAGGFTCPDGLTCAPEVTLEPGVDRDVLACRVATPVSSLTGFVIPSARITLASATRNHVEDWSAP